MSFKALKLNLVPTPGHPLDLIEYFERGHTPVIRTIIGFSHGSLQSLMELGATVSKSSGDVPTELELPRGWRINKDADLFDMKGRCRGRIFHWQLCLLGRYGVIAPGFMRGAIFEVVVADRDQVTGGEEKVLHRVATVTRGDKTARDAAIALGESWLDEHHFGWRSLSYGRED